MPSMQNKITSAFKRDHSHILHKKILEQIQQNSSPMPLVDAGLLTITHEFGYQ